MFVFGDQNWRTKDSLDIENILQAIHRRHYQVLLDNDEVISIYYRYKSIHYIFIANTNAPKQLFIKYCTMFKYLY